MIPAPLVPFADHLWQSTLFAAGAGLIVLLLRSNRAEVRYRIWLIASLKFLIPFSLLIGSGLQVRWRRAPAEAHPAFFSVLDRVGEPFAARAPLVYPPRIRPSPVPFAVGAVWLLGFAGASIPWFRRWRRVRHARRAASPVDWEGRIPVMSSPALFEPGVYGIFRPVLLLPAGIVGRLTAPQLRSIIAHELCHVRRRDNLGAAIHMFVETVFWFHPLVWWIGARLLEERERACDEHVLAQGSHPGDYAEGILNVCKFYVESPLACVSGVSGSNLKHRIEAIMTNRTPKALDSGRRALLAASASAAVIVPIVIGLLNAPASRAQSRDAALPQFEVATIKPSKPGIMGGGLGIWANKFSGNNQSLQDLVWFAYGTGYWHKGLVIGGPEWAKSARYDVVAQTERLAKGAEMKLMVRQLLAERFKLQFHEETRQLPVYALVVARSNETTRARLRPASPADIKYCDALAAAFNAAIDAGQEPEVRDERLPDGSRRCRASSGGGNKLTFRARPISDLAEMLVEIVDRMVIDKTGLQGRYDIDMEVDQEFEFDHLFDEAGDALEKNSAVFTVLQEQLGLKLESTRGPAPVIVIDSAARPSEN
jgi:bla regulator protein BlaR1